MYPDCFLDTETEHAASLLLTLTGLASLAVSHVVEDVLHCAAVRQVALPNLAVCLLPPLALVCMKQEYQLLLDQLALFRVSCGRCTSCSRCGRNLGTRTDQTCLIVGHHSLGAPHWCTRGTTHTRLRWLRSLE